MALRGSTSRRWSSFTTPWTFDIALAVLVTSFIVLASGHIRPSADDRALDALGYTAMLVAGGNANVSAGRALATLTVYVMVAAALAAMVFARRDVTA